MPWELLGNPDMRGTSLCLVTYASATRRCRDRERTRIWLSPGSRARGRGSEGGSVQSLQGL